MGPIEGGVQGSREVNHFARYLDRGVSRSHALWRAHEVGAIKPELLKPPILDLGSGHGELASVLFHDAETSPFTVGVDISHSELKKAKRSGKYTLLTHGDARKLPFHDESFQTVFSFSVLEHIPNVEDVFKEAMRVLKPDGQFIFTVPLKEMEYALYYPRVFNKLGFNGLSNLYTNKLQSALKHHNMWPQEKWEELAEENGASIHTAKKIVPEQVVYEWDKYMPFAALRKKINSTATSERRKIRLTRKFNESFDSDANGNGTNLLLVLEKSQKQG